MKCIYCGTEKDFNREHVIPQCFGAFEQCNPTIKKDERLICKNCNSNIFSALESEFKEDAREGIDASMLRLTGSNSVRVKGQNVKMNCLSSEDAFFNEIFPFLKQENGKFVIDFQPQVKVRNYGGENGYQIFPLQSLKNIFEDAQKSKTKLDNFNKVKRRLKTTGENNIAIFATGDTENDDQQLNETIKLLKAYGINYKERERKFNPLNKKNVEIDMTWTITPNTCRFLAKIAFNYLIYCAIEEKKVDILYGKNFDKIKTFILGTRTVERKEIIVEISDDPITYHEKESGFRHVGHTIVFFQENGFIYSKITLLGRQVYKILLGEAVPTEFFKESFGCGHLFNPFDNSIHPLTQSLNTTHSKSALKKSFGLYKRLQPKEGL